MNSLQRFQYGPLNKPATTDPAVLALWEELLRLKQGLEAPSDYDQLQYLAVEPSRPKAGMLVFANGTNWNPGQGAGLYRRNEANLAWDFHPVQTSGTFLPVITFTTPGNLAVAYTLQSGAYIKQGSLVTAVVQIVTSSFAHTTASGSLEITGMPFAATSGGGTTSAVEVQNVTKATYTCFTARMVASDAKFRVIATGSGVVSANVMAADMPTGGTVRIFCTMIYPTA